MRTQIIVALIAFLLLRLANDAHGVVERPLAFARLIRTNLMERRPSTNWCEDPPRQDPNCARPVSPRRLRHPSSAPTSNPARPPRHGAGGMSAMRRINRAGRSWRQARSDAGVERPVALARHHIDARPARHDPALATCRRCEAAPKQPRAQAPATCMPTRRPPASAAVVTEPGSGSRPPGKTRR